MWKRALAGASGEKAETWPDGGTEHTCCSNSLDSGAARAAAEKIDGARRGEGITTSENIVTEEIVPLERACVNHVRFYSSPITN